jgi:Tol biopolymer transport system component
VVRLVLSVPGGHARCPRWSADGSRLAYLDHGKVVVRGLDGSTRKWGSGDPVLQDFKSKPDLRSPTGNLIARPGNGAILVSRPDGSDRRLIPDNLGGEPSYAIAGWSPDGRKVLLMKDVGGGFNMRAVSVEPPFASETVVAFARVNDERSWPGYGDVSWQPIPQT